MYKGVEADDLIYTVVKELKNCVILSTDADLLQLEVPQYSYTKSKYITLDDQGFTDSKTFIEAKAIAGDNSDGIPGLERVGLKTVIKYFNKYDVSTFFDLRDSIPKNTKSKIEQRILNGTEVYERNIKLVDIGLINSEIVTSKMKQEVMEAINEFSL